MGKREIKQLELLAPAGDIESFNAAIANGADAIYLGLSHFNARAKAQNFSTENLREHIEKAHFHSVKVYITLNTLLQNNEFIDMFRLVKTAILSKVDAFIVQDLGVCYALKKAFPNIVLHASTQMGIHNLYGAKQAEKLGISRVVLSRETKLSDIKEIAENTELELEYFVQGALCVAFSGNCYLSSETLGCSGNRGLCKQPCRMFYTGDNNGNRDEGYFLSARDLCLIDNLSTLAGAGVTSFKIEGRLRRAGYVAVATSCYRKAIDDIINAHCNNGANNPDTENVERKQGFLVNDESKQLYKKTPNISKQINSHYNDEKFKLSKVFNRGDYLETAYLFDEVPEGVINKQSQNHQGILIGKVLDIKPFKDIFAITIKSSHKVVQGDGLKLFDEGKEVTSLGVGSVKDLGNGVYTVFTKAKAKAGQSVNLILDSAAERDALSAQKFVEAEFSVQAIAGEKLKLFAKSGDVETRIESEFVCEKAINKATDASEIKQQIEKTGDTDFKTTKTYVETDGVFLPKSVLNGLRREVLDALKAKIIENNEKHLSGVVLDDEIHRLLDIVQNKEQKLEHYQRLEKVQGQAVIVEGQEHEQGQSQAVSMQTKGQNKEQQKQVQNEKLDATLTYVYTNSNFSDITASIVAISPNAYVENDVAKMYRNVKDKNLDCKVCLELPIVANGKDLSVIKNLLSSLKEKGIEFDFLVSNNLYGLQFGEFGQELIAGFGHNVCNNAATYCLKELGAKMVVESVENQERLSSALPVLDTKNFKLPLMTFAHCPYKTVDGSTCKKCSYNGKLIYQKGVESYDLRRIKLSQCYFSLQKAD